MSRYCGEHNSEPILRAATHWRQQCLEKDGSVFSVQALWRAENFEALERYYIGQPEEGERGFFEKLKDQLSPTTPDVKKLAAEMLWVMLLCPSNITAEKKSEIVRLVWAWSGGTLPVESPWLALSVLDGIGSAGTSYSHYRWRELAFFIRLMLGLKKASPAQREELLGDGWKLAKWLEAVPEANTRQFRPMMLFMLFPDDFERIFGGNDRRRIVRIFTNKSKAEVRTLSAFEIDRQLNAIRKEQEGTLGNTQIDFYLSPLKEKWERLDQDEDADEVTEPEQARPVRYWIEKTLVSGRPDRQSGDHAMGKALWSPQTGSDGRDTYRTMREVQAGDMVLHLVDNSEIRGISIAVSTADDSFTGLPGTDWANRRAFRIPLRDYTELRPPLARGDFLGNPNYRGRLTAIVNAHRGLFFSRTLELNQGAYLTEAPHELLTLLNEAYVEKTGRQLPLLTVGTQTLTENAWIFQANPEYYDIDSAIRELQEIQWLVNQHSDSIRVGDRVYIWRSGEDAGIIGVGSVASNPQILEPDSAEEGYSRGTERFTGAHNRVRVRIVKVLGSVLTRDQIRRMPELANLSILRFANRTNFAVTPAEATVISRLADETPSIIPAQPLVSRRAEESVPEPDYSVERAQADLFIERAEFSRILDTLRAKKNLILQGPPGVGKTFFAKRLAYALMRQEAPKRVGMVQFHQSYSYEDFVQGYRPTGSGFVLKNGIFFEFAESARRDSGKDYVFIIDEINRGNLSKVLGELMMLIESDKRSREWAVPLAYARSADERFYVPANMYLIGLMNTADRSLAMVDYALRRRFAFIRIPPAFAAPSFRAHLVHLGASAGLVEKIVDRMTKLNEEIARDTTNLGAGFCIGHSYFCVAPRADEAWYREVISTEIAPLLREYWFDDSPKAEDWISRLLA